LVPQFKEAGLKIAPLCLVKQGKVTIADNIALHLGAGLSLILIGERPGLSAADSMRAYLTYDPKPGLTDESRKLRFKHTPPWPQLQTAARKIFYLVQQAFRRKISGVGLKDNAGQLND